jgi:hypothetical protein
MKRRQAIVAGLVVGVLASAGVMAAAAGKAPVRGRVRSVGPALAPDNGAGELLIAVVGGVFPSRQEAEAANETLVFGDLQGYYVVPVAQFQGFRQQVGEPGDFALVSAFRRRAPWPSRTSPRRSGTPRRSCPNGCGASAACTRVSARRRTRMARVPCSVR